MIIFQFSLLDISYANIKIIASVDDEIITNYDVQKESRYLKILSPNLRDLDEKKILFLAKQSLIKEKIKKTEISKFIDLNTESSFVDDYIANLFLKLGYKNKQVFRSSLMENETYTLEEVKLKIKIEVFWNDLIFNRYNNQIIVDKKKLTKKLNDIESKEKKEFSLSEIIFKKIKNEKISDTILKIKKSIEEIGFNNTANIYSISNSSKFGGNIGWIKEDVLSQKIYENIINLNANEYTDIMQLNDNFLILKINEIRMIQNTIDREKELQQLIERETSKKLEKFSRIYFNKVKTQYLINEK